MSDKWEHPAGTYDRASSYRKREREGEGRGRGWGRRRGGRGRGRGWGKGKRTINLGKMDRNVPREEKLFFNRTGTWRMRNRLH